VLRKNGHEVAFAAFHGLQGIPITGPDGVVTYPGSSEDAYSQDILPLHYQHFRADLLITLMDAWILDPARLAGMNVAHWMPVDCSPLGSMDRRILDAGPGRPVAMSRFGEAMLRDAGYDALYAPHALDLSVWKPLADRKAARQALGMDGRFVIGINAANQDPFRKGFGEQLAAFAQFAKRHDDALMLIHSRAQTRQGVNLAKLIGELGIGRQVMVGDQYQIAAGLIPESQMADWHGLLDLCSNCSYGEGFGLAILQSLAVGTPVAVTDCSSMTELCGAGWLVQGQPAFNRGHDAFWRVPFISSITQAYEQAYEKAAGKREQAVAFAQRYDADRVYADYWAVALKELIPGGS